MVRPRTWVEISKPAVRHNFEQLRKLIAPVPLAPVIKANAYGHGILELISCLDLRRMWGVCVANGAEAINLRDHQYRGRILVMSSWQSDQLSELINRQVDLAVWDLNSLKLINQAAKKINKSINIHIKLDCGTTRIGFLEPDFQKLSLDLKRRHKNINIAAAFSHLANSESANPTITSRQLERFATLRKSLNLSDRGAHIACTAAALRYPASRLDMVRYGLGLYGLWPSIEIKNWVYQNIPKFNLQPVLTWYSKLLQIKRVTAGTRIGYGWTYRVKRPTTLGIIPVGYADGYRRQWSNQSWVMVAGQRAPVLGRICMNLIMVDLKWLKSPRQNQIVTLIGDGIEADRLAKIGQTINYEVVTAIHPDIPRIIV